MQVRHTQLEEQVVQLQQQLVVLEIQCTGYIAERDALSQALSAQESAGRSGEPSGGRRALPQVLDL